MNVLSVTIGTDAAEDALLMFRSTIINLADVTPSFRGMLGMIDDETGDAMSISLNENARNIELARESDWNQAEIDRYRNVFVSDIKRELFRLDVRYTPMKRPFPGPEVMFARATAGWVRPETTSATVARSRNTLVYAAIFERGCCGYLLGSDETTGKILGISLWDTRENMLASESADGYYHREMAKHDNVIEGELIRQRFRVFDRELAPTGQST